MKKPLKKTSIIATARAQARAAAAYEAAAARIEKSDGKLMPLDYMLGVIRDTTATQDRRDRMAIAAAPYCHPRMADAVKGKKDQQAEAAATAGVGTPWADDLKFEGHAN
jgi:hypothetical protein